MQVLLSVTFAVACILAFEILCRLGHTPPASQHALVVECRASAGGGGVPNVDPAGGGRAGDGVAGAAGGVAGGGDRVAGRDGRAGSCAGAARRAARRAPHPHGPPRPLAPPPPPHTLPLPRPRRRLLRAPAGGGAGRARRRGAWLWREAPGRCLPHHRRHGAPEPEAQRWEN
eukprot:108393-Rhodomonas_salina.1